MNYIGYKQAEELLKKLPLLKALLSNMQIELRRWWGTGQNGTFNEKDILYSLAIGNKVLSDMPRSTRAPGDKELNIILAKDRIIEEEIKGLINSINTIGEVVEKTGSALRGLPAEQQEILLQFFCEDRTWGEIAKKMYMERDALKERKYKAINKILPILRITHQQFEFCMNEIQEMPKERKTQSV